MNVHTDGFLALLVHTLNEESRWTERRINQFSNVTQIPAKSGRKGIPLTLEMNHLNLVGAEQRHTLNIPVMHPIIIYFKAFQPLIV